MTSEIGTGMSYGQKLESGQVKAVRLEYNLGRLKWIKVGLLSWVQSTQNDSRHMYFYKRPLQYNMCYLGDLEVLANVGSKYLERLNQETEFSL